MVVAWSMQMSSNREAKPESEEEYVLSDIDHTTNKDHKPTVNNDDNS